MLVHYHPANGSLTIALEKLALAEGDLPAFADWMIDVFRDHLAADGRPVIEAKPKLRIFAPAAIIEMLLRVFPSHAVVRHRGALDLAVTDLRILNLHVLLHEAEPVSNFEAAAGGTAQDVADAIEALTSFLAVSILLS